MIRAAMSPDTNKDAQNGVLQSLPAARPQRRSPKRDRASSPRASRPSAPPRRPRTASTARKRTQRRQPRPVAKQGYEVEDGRGPVEPPSGAEILAAAVEAAGELAEIGLTLGERLLRSVARRLPKP
jgi:hypothetical protein